VALLPELLIVKHFLRIPVREQMKLIIAPVISSIVMASSLLLIDLLFNHTMTSLTMLIMLLPLGAMIYIALIYVLKPHLLRIIISLPHKSGSSVPI
jgi:hypothetical protein